MDSDGEEAARGGVLSHAGRKIEAGVTRVGPKDRNACELGSAIAHSSINLDAFISLIPPAKPLVREIFSTQFFFPVCELLHRISFSEVARMKRDVAIPAALSDNPVTCQ